MNLFNFESVIAFGKTLYLKLLEKSQFSRFSFFSGFQNKLSLPISTINNLLEGDGGILWAILCLVLVITILQSLGLS
jgi:predicted permease